MSQQWINRGKSSRNTACIAYAIDYSFDWTYCLAQVLKRVSLERNLPALCNFAFTGCICVHNIHCTDLLLYTSHITGICWFSVFLLVISRMGCIQLWDQHHTFRLHIHSHHCTSSINLSRAWARCAIRQCLEDSMPARRRGTCAGNPNRPSQRLRREAGLSVQDLREPVEPDHPPPEVERSRSARAGTHASQRVTLRPRETESSVAVPVARSVAVPLPPGQAADQGFWAYVAPATGGGEVPAVGTGSLPSSSPRPSAPVVPAEVPAETPSEVPEPAEPPKGTARTRAKRDLSPIRRRPSLIKGKPQTKEQALAQALANEQAGGQAVVDCRLEYRALLEAYSPGKPPLEIAQQFLDKLSGLQKAWHQLKKGREELEKALRSFRTSQPLRLHLQKRSRCVQLQTGLWPLWKRPRTSSKAIWPCCHYGQPVIDGYRGALSASNLRFVTATKTKGLGNWRSNAWIPATTFSWVACFEANERIPSTNSLPWRRWSKERFSDGTYEDPSEASSKTVCANPAQLMAFSPSKCPLAFPDGIASPCMLAPPQRWLDDGEQEAGSMTFPPEKSALQRVKKQAFP